MDCSDKHTCNKYKNPYCKEMVIDQTVGPKVTVVDLSETLKKELDKDIPEIAVIPEIPKIPDGCISYFDGCNNCMVSNGVMTACTYMTCKKYEEPRCNKFSENITDGCQVWNDGCNDCIVESG